MKKKSIKQMMQLNLKRLISTFIFLVLSASASASDIQIPGINIELENADEVVETATAFKLLLTLTLLSLAPSILVIVTSFTRIIIVLSMLRHALGMQQTPPNTVLISLALLMTIFNMTPVFEEINTTAFQPYLSNQIDTNEVIENSMKPLRGFMIRQTREQDLGVVLELNNMEAPESVDDISNIHLISAFLLSELKTAFQIGFVIFLPFLLVDLVVASILMSMGMIMVPPMMISLPLKILMFVLIDGWILVVQSLLNSFV